jgi:hypothetical protein
MVVVVEEVDIDLVARFEMARDKLTKESIAWKEFGEKANLRCGWLA